MEIRKLLRRYGIRNFNLPHQNEVMVKTKREREREIFYFFHEYCAEFSPSSHLISRRWLDTSWSKTCQHLWRTRWCSLKPISSQHRRFTIFMSSSWPVKEKYVNQNEPEKTNVFLHSHSCVFNVFLVRCHCQIEECLTALKKLSPAEAECVIERLTSWARGHLQDKDHISEEVRGHCGFVCSVLLEATVQTSVVLPPTAQETSNGHC